MEVHEFNIPVPWGHIAAKTWGIESNQFVLMFHGMWDNAGTFDRLIPHLPKHYYYICIELPGHGKSSHFPYGVPMHSITFIAAYKAVADYLKKKRYMVIGHSWGGKMALLFTQLYPEYVTKLIILDVVYIYPISIDYFKDYMRRRFQQMSQINKKLSDTNKQPTYTYEEALEKLQEGRLYGELKPEAAKALLKSGLATTNDGKFKFSFDYRIRYLLNVFHGRDFVNDFMRKNPVTCPILFIMADDSVDVMKYFKVLIKELQKVNVCCFIRKVKGNHDVHNNNPEIVAPIISTFLNHTFSKL